LIFAPFDAADISALKYVKKFICLCENFLIKRGNTDDSERAVLIRDIDCISAVTQLISVFK
jgi:hypothetical protein